MIVGWTLVNSCIETSHSLKMEEMISFFKDKNLIPANSRVALGQKFLDYDYRGKGIMDLATTIQEEITSSKFDIYLSTVQRTNKPSEFFFKKNSFKLIYEDDIRFYFTKPVIKKNIPLVQVLHIEIDNRKTTVTIRPSQIGDEIQLHELNKKWLKENRRGDLSKGFLHVLYSPDEFLKMIKLKEVVICEIN